MTRDYFTASAVAAILNSMNSKYSHTFTANEIMGPFYPSVMLTLNEEDDVMGANIDSSATILLRGK